jgi:hypothetical protein
MKKKTVLTLAGIASIASASAQGLYYVGQEANESIPLTWVAGASMIWDNNVTPLITPGNPGFEDEAWSINPYIQANFTNVDPQTTINFYARLGANYYIESLEAQGADEIVPNMRLGFDFNHSVSPRLRFSSRNFLSYEMEPEFAVGISNDRTVEPYFFYSSDNSVGYRWTERVGSYTGFGFTGYMGDVQFADRKSWNIYHQMRYQFNQRTVLTSQYRYAAWTGDANESTNHFITGGVEYRLSQNSVFVGSAGVQFRSVDNGGDNSSPFLEASVRSQMNSSFSIRGFARFSMEDFDTIQFVGGNTFEYSNQQVLRLGMTGEYRLSPRLTGFGGMDLIHTMYDDGNQVNTPISGTGKDSGRTEDLVNAYIGLRTRLTDELTGDCSINYTDSTSDFENNDYDRIRLSAGLSYAF